MVGRVQGEQVGGGEPGAGVAGRVLRRPVAALVDGGGVNLRSRRIAAAVAWLAVTQGPSLLRTRPRPRMTA